MKKLLTVIILLVSVVSFSQVNKLVDFKLGMSYNEIIKEFPNMDNKTKTTLSYVKLEMSNGVVLTNVFLSFYDDKLYGIMSDYNDAIHEGLSKKYDYTSVDDAPFEGYYGSSYESNVVAFVNGNNEKIIIVNRKIHNKALTYGF